MELEGYVDSILSEEMMLGMKGMRGVGASEHGAGAVTRQSSEVTVHHPYIPTRKLKEVPHVEDQVVGEPLAEDEEIVGSAAPAGNGSEQTRKRTQEELKEECELMENEITKRAGRKRIRTMVEMREDMKKILRLSQDVEELVKNTVARRSAMLDTLERGARTTSRGNFPPPRYGTKAEMPLVTISDFYRDPIDVIGSPF